MYKLTVMRDLINLMVSFFFLLYFPFLKLEIAKDWKTVYNLRIYLNLPIQTSKLIYNLLTWKSICSDDRRTIIHFNNHWFFYSFNIPYRKWAKNQLVWKQNLLVGDKGTSVTCKILTGKIFLAPSLNTNALISANIMCRSICLFVLL